MAREFSRTDRIAQQIHREVAAILQNEYKKRDPSLGFVTVSGVEVSRDLAHAKVFVTFFESDSNKIATYLQSLDKHKGFVRSALAKRIRMRAVPSLNFKGDSSVTEGTRIANLVSQTVNSDRERAKLAGRDWCEDGEQ